MLQRLVSGALAAGLLWWSGSSSAPTVPSPPGRVAPISAGVAATRFVAQPEPTVAAKAWIVVDADTGRVIAARADHRLERPASIIKLLTALIAVESLRPNATVEAQEPTSAIEALNIGMEPGQPWALDDVLHALLMDSSNDAGYALAHTVAGSLPLFAGWMKRAASLLRLPDHPVLKDPSGLDDDHSFEGGDYISAYDMAIIGRDVLDVPLLRQIVDTSTYHFISLGNVPYTLHTINHLLMYYPGAIGLKTGYTQRAGNTMVAAATRNGRTILAVELDAPNLYGTASQLLDIGFATPSSAESRVDQLPRPHPSALLALSFAPALYAFIQTLGPGHICPGQIAAPRRHSRGVSSSS